MNKILIACTYHNQARTTLHKTLRSSQWRDQMPSNWRRDVVIFSHDRASPVNEFTEVITYEETLGGKRNFAVKHARANNYQLIAFLDDDDMLGPSWIPGVCAQAETDFAAGSTDRIYHPQWNVLFDPNAWVIREHIGQSDPRFDSRDMMFYNPWSALCAFSPMSARWLYRKHKKTDPRLSFEDWSFNLDTWCDGQEHVVVPNTFHFLRMRANSLGKSTLYNTLEHTRYFKEPELIQKTMATQSLTESAEIDNDMLQAEMRRVMDIEPQIYFHRVPKTVQQYNNRAAGTADKVAELAKRMPFAKDVFWTHDHKRIGGAEKALAWVSEFLLGFKDERDGIPNQVWVDDVTVNTDDKEAVMQWMHGVTHLLRVWAQEGKPRSLHICNSGAAWMALSNNPALFDNVQVYLYVFNDDLIFPAGTMDMKFAGYHSPIYGCAEVLDRPNIHLITDSDHYSKRLASITGLGDKIRKISIPVRGMPNKRKKEPNGIVDILCANRWDHFKGIEELLSYCEGEKNASVTVYGDGPREFTDKLIDADSRGKLNYGGRYDNFANIPGEYDFFLFTSEREGMPNTVREARESGLAVLAKDTAWAYEFGASPPVTTYKNGELVQTIELIVGTMPHSLLASGQFSVKACEPLTIAAFREALVK